MKLSQLAKRLLAVASTVGLALLITSCGASNTIDFIYVTANQQDPGKINAYQVDSVSGALYQIPDSPYSSGGRNPVYDVTTPNGNFLYVANHDDNTIVEFAIGIDGKLYPLQTVNTPGTEPVALAMNPSGTYLYVLDYYAPAAPGQASYTDLNPGPGAVMVMPIDQKNGHLGAALTVGTANYWDVQCFPTNLAVTPDGGYLYVTNTNSVVVTSSPPVTGTVPTRPTACPDSGTVSGFKVDGTTTGGAQTVTGLTPIAGSPFGAGAGAGPTGIIADPDNAALYVTDGIRNLLDTYTIGSGGVLSLASQVATGTMPMGALVVNTGSTGKYLYVTNYQDGSISSYSLNTGTPVPLTTTSSGASGPLCLLVDPETSRLMYIADYTGNQVGGLLLDPTTGGLITNMNQPYPTAGQPTCVAGVAHPGNPQGL